MTTDDRTYELYILKKFVNTYLDETVPATEEALKSLVFKCDETVWKIATEIYNQSGHKVEFSVVRDVVNSRIEVLKMHIVATKKTAAYEHLQFQKIEEARQAQEVQQKVEAENRRQNHLVELARLDESGRNTSTSNLFLKVQAIVSEQLSVGLNEVTLSRHISNDLGADELDTVELAMALEEEFEVEIPEDMLGSVKKWPPSYSSNTFGDSDPVACTVGELLDFIHKQVSS